MNVRHQHGHLRIMNRKTGAPCWEFLWRETDASGRRVRRNAVVATIIEYPTRALAEAAVNGLRVAINQDHYRQRQQSITVNDLIDHYIATELAEKSTWHSHATRIVYREYLIRWIKPYWGFSSIRDVRTIAVEGWLRNLQREDGAASRKFHQSQNP